MPKKEIFKHNKEDILVQRIDFTKSFEADIDDREDDIVDAVRRKVQDWSWRRQDLEYLWKACWAHYFNTPQSANYLRAEALSLGQSVDENDWRHKVHTGKGYDLVETVNSYFQQAFFPNNDWFDLEPLSPQSDEWKEKLLRVKSLMRKKLTDAYFEDWWDIFCRQLAVVGTSVLALPWRYDIKPVKRNIKIRKPSGQEELKTVSEDRVIYNGLDIEVIDMFDFFLDPDGMFSSYIQSNCIRRLRKTKAEVIRLIHDGIYERGDIEKVRLCKPSSYLDTDSDKDAQDIKGMLGLEYWESNYNLNDTVELWEYWGNLFIGDIEYQDVVVTVLDDQLLNIEHNPFWDGKPFICGTYVNTQGSPYGVGILQPVIGQLHQMFIIQNHRLDVSELTINPMYQVVNDGILDLENLYSAPGKVLEVDAIGNIAPIQLDKDNSISVQDESLLESRIDKTTGVGAYLGVNAGRDAERVTAEEVKAQRDAGGNRLNRIHAHIETTSLHCFLKKMYSHLQQFITDDEMVRTPGQEYGIAYDFWLVGVEELYDDYDVQPLGSAHVADKEYEIKNATDFVSIMSSNPELSSRINWDEMSSYLARKFLKEKWEKFILLQSMGQPQQAASPMDSASLDPSMMGGMEAQQQMMPPDMGTAQQSLSQSNPLVQESYGAMGQPGEQMMTELMSNPEAYSQFLGNSRKEIYGRKSKAQ